MTEPTKKIDIGIETIDEEKGEEIQGHLLPDMVSIGRDAQTEKGQIGIEQTEEKESVDIIGMSAKEETDDAEVGVIVERKIEKEYMEEVQGGVIPTEIKVEEDMSKVVDHQWEM